MGQNFDINKCHHIQEDILSKPQVMKLDFAKCKWISLTFNPRALTEGLLAAPYQLAMCHSTGEIMSIDLSIFSEMTQQRVDL
jgi:hypothetical protein